MNTNFKIFAEFVEETAMNQFYETMKQDSTVQAALMPDAHAGYTLPIGSVVAVDGMVYPSYVGYDIGCGMVAQKLDVTGHLVRNNAENIYKRIQRVVPVGFKVHKNKGPRHNMLKVDNLTIDAQKIAEKKKWCNALGTLGGGNHFIEVGSDENDIVWVVIHSGSRGVGHGIAHHYMKLASPTGKASEGHYGFRTDSDLGQDYINDLMWAQQYALENRKYMMQAVIDAMEYCLGVTAFGVDDMINRNHNHAEEKDGLWIHRKGATHAEEGMMGVIPGNMRDGSFIVRGKGNPDSLCSSSHGAGRVLGRKKAKETLDQNEFSKTMEGIVANVGASTLDESPMAYKDIYEVMEQQKDLVEVVAHVKPILNVKG